MRSIELNVVSRQSEDSAHRLRKTGVLPGVLYGAGADSVRVQVDGHEFGKSGLASHGAHLIRLRSAEAALDQGLALIQEIQGHPVSGKPIHVDFLRVDANKPVKPAFGKSHRELFLIIGQNVHAEMHGLFEVAVYVGAVVNADQHQRRFDGNTGKRVCGETVRRAIGGERR